MLRSKDGIECLLNLLTILYSMMSLFAFSGFLFFILIRQKFSAVPLSSQLSDTAGFIFCRFRAPTQTY